MTNIKRWMLIAGACLITTPLTAIVAHAQIGGGGGGGIGGPGGLIPAVFYDTTDPRLPSPTYRSTNSVSYTNGSAVFMIDSFFDVFADFERHLPPTSPGAEQINSFFDVFVEVDMNSNVFGPVHIRESPTKQSLRVLSLNGLPPGVPYEYDTEMLSLGDPTGGIDLSGNGLLKIRESPTLQSLGHTTIDDRGGGNYRIASFFDVFTELSIDGGASWMTGSESLHLFGTTSVVPELSSCLVWLVGTLAIGYFRPRRAA